MIGCFPDPHDLFDENRDESPGAFPGLRRLRENSVPATDDASRLREFISEGPPEAGDDMLRMINTGTIGKYVSKWGHRAMTYLGQKYDRPVVSKRNFCKRSQTPYGKKSAKKKLILKGLNLLDGCLDADGSIIPEHTANTDHRI